MIKLNFLFSIFYSVFIISSETKNEQTLIVSYSAIECTCAQWKIENKKTEKNIYLERASNEILDANHIWDGKTLPLKLQLKGHFKNQIGIPKDYPTKGNPKPAKVFLYSQIKVIK